MLSVILDVDAAAHIFGFGSEADMSARTVMETSPGAWRELRVCDFAFVGRRLEEHARWFRSPATELPSGW